MKCMGELPIEQSYGTCSEDSIQKFEQVKAKSPFWKSEIFKNTLNAMGGMYAIGNSQSDALGVTRSQFIRIYDSLLNQETKKELLPPKLQMQIEQIRETQKLMKLLAQENGV